MASARKRGKHIGRQRKLTDKQIAKAARKPEEHSSSITVMAKSLGVSKLTLSRAIK